MPLGRAYTNVQIVSIIAILKGIFLSSTETFVAQILHKCRKRTINDVLAEKIKFQLNKIIIDN